MESTNGLRADCTPGTGAARQYLERMSSSSPPDVQAVFDAYPPAVRSRLLELRSLILDIAATTPGAGPLDETLKWGQPSYLTAETGSGTTVRLGPKKGDDASCCLFIHCQTSLVDRFRALPDAGGLVFEGTRAVVFDVDDPLPEGAAVFVRAALTYHRDKG